MFGVSFSEVVLIAVVALIVVGPRRLPEILGTMGKWVGKVRRMTTEVRRQTGIDEILRAEGIGGGIAELRSMMRGELANVQRIADSVRRDVTSLPSTAVVDHQGEAVEFDRLREHPVEGPDAYGTIPEDLLAAAAPNDANVPEPPPAPAPNDAASPGPGSPPKDSA